VVRTRDEADGFFATVLALVDKFVVFAVVVDVLPEFSSVHDVQELGTTADADADLAHFLGRTVYQVLTEVTFFVVASPWVDFVVVQRRMDVLPTCEDNDVSVAE
jgi:hypothetical protein